MFETHHKKDQIVEDINKYFNFNLGIKQKLAMFTVFMLAGRLPVPKKRPRKRKSFADLTVNGRRRGLRDLRGLMNEKAQDYSVPASRIAGFIIQQVVIEIGSCQIGLFEKTLV